MIDIHNLGEYTSLSDVWKLFPNGGGYGDYILLNGVRYDWKETSNSWTESSITEYPSRPGEVIDHNVKVLGSLEVSNGLQVGPYIEGQSGAEIDEFGNGEFRTLSIDQLLVKDGAGYIPLAKLIQQFKTELPPNWAEYQEIKVLNEARVLIFNPNSNEKYYVTYESLKSSIVSGIEVGEGGSITLDIISSNEPALLTENNVLSSLRTLVEIERLINEKGGLKFISKVSPDTAQGLIKFIEGIDINFIRGISGGNIDKYANAELNSLRLREFLEVPELRYNRISVFTGVQWNTFGAGIIESVEVDKDVNGNELQSGIIKLKLENGEFGSVAVDDLCQGIFHNFGGVNDTTSEDQKNGNFHIKGFNTSYFRITEILDTGTNGLFRYVLRGTSEKWTQLNHPRSQMHFAAYANPSNPDRQSCSYTTTEYSIRLKNMTTWEYGANNIYEISGKLDGFTIGETVLEGKGQAFGNAYIWGTLQQIYNDPIRLDIDTNGDGFLAFGETMTITCNVFKGWKDITSNVEIWGISRESGNQTEDDAWNISHQDFAGQITLQNKAEYSDLGNGISTLFRFTASSASNTAILELTI